MRAALVTVCVLTQGCASTVPHVDSSRLAAISFDRKLEMYRAEHDFDVARARRDDLARATRRAEERHEAAQAAASRARDQLEAEEGILEILRATNERARVTEQEQRARRARSARETAEAREELTLAERDLAIAEADRGELEEQAGDARVQHLRVQLLRRYAPRRVPEEAGDIEEIHSDLQADLRERRAEASSLRTRVTALRRRGQELVQRGPDHHGSARRRP